MENCYKVCTEVFGTKLAKFMTREVNRLHELQIKKFEHPGVTYYDLTNKPLSGKIIKEFERTHPNMMKKYWNERTHCIRKTKKKLKFISFMSALKGYKFYLYEERAVFKQNGIMRVIKFI